MSSETLGEFEQCLLLAVVHLGDGAYGVAIRQQVEQRTGRDVAIGALYTSLSRLESKGYVRSRMSDPTAQRGGRSKRYFTLTPAGAAGSPTRGDSGASVRVPGRRASSRTRNCHAGWRADGAG